MKAEAGTGAAVIKTMNRMVDSYKMRDMEALVACFAPEGRSSPLLHASRRG